MDKLITNVVKCKYRFEVTCQDGSKKKITVEAESPAAAVLNLPEDVVEWRIIGNKKFRNGGV